MIAAQLLAYYFTELKDDQLKKVSESDFERPQWSFCGLESCVMWEQPGGQPWTPVSGTCMSARSRRGVSGWERRMQHLESRGKGGHVELQCGFDSVWVCSGVCSVWHGCPWEGLWSWWWWGCTDPLLLSVSGASVARAAEADRCLRREKSWAPPSLSSQADFPAHFRSRLLATASHSLTSLERGHKGR